VSGFGQNLDRAVLQPGKTLDQIESMPAATSFATTVSTSQITATGADFSRWPEGLVSISLVDERYGQITWPKKPATGNLAESG
jgi:hypothetical protein